MTPTAISAAIIAQRAYRCYQESDLHGEAEKKAEQNLAYSLILTVMAVAGSILAILGMAGVFSANQADIEKARCTSIEGAVYEGGYCFKNGINIKFGGLDGSDTNN